MVRNDIEEQPTINWVLDSICELPHSLLEKWYLPSDGEKDILDDKRHLYEKQVVLLDRYFSGKTTGISSQDDALAYAAYMDLRLMYGVCAELVSRGAVSGITPENQSYLHLILWQGYAVSQCAWVLFEQNIPNLGTPKLVGKEASCKERSEATTKFSLSETTIQQHQHKQLGTKYGTVEFIKQDHKDFDSKKEFWIYLHGLAFKLAKEDSSFRNIFWEPYLRMRCDQNNMIKESDCFQRQYILPNGYMFTTGKNKKLPKVN